MNKKQLKLAIISVEADCDIRFDFQDGRGRTCAVGGLAESAGLGDINADGFLRAH